MARVYLLVSAVGPLPVALSYGIVPGQVLLKVMEVTVEGRDLTHVFRAIMGLYLGMIVFWVLGALRPGLTAAARAELTDLKVAATAAEVDQQLIALDQRGS